MNNYKLEIEAIKPVEQSVNHVFAVDVSGSMYDVLPKMRSHIKSKLALLVKPKDTVSIIYFSSKSQYGEVYKEEIRNGSVVKTIKKYKEAVVFPYDNFSKQSKREIKHKKEWNSIAYALGKNRNSWYKNFINYINNKTMNDGVNPKVDETLLLPKELFNHEYDPFAINPS